MRYLLLVLLVVCGAQAQAQTVNRQAKLDWTAPTTCSGGSALTNCPTTGYLIQKRVNNAWVDLATTAAGVTTYTEQNVALGTHTYRVWTNSANGLSLTASNEGSKTLDVPGAPGNLVITITVTVTP